MIGRDKRHRNAQLEIPKIKDNKILKDELALWLKFIENSKNKEVEKLMCENIFLK